MQRLMAEYGFPFLIWYGTLWLSSLGTLVALLHYEIVGWNDIVSMLTSPRAPPETLPVGEVCVAEWCSW